MKHLTQRSAFCLPALLVLALFAFSVLTPRFAFAIADYTNALGMTEGDPIDGLGSPSAGGYQVPGTSDSSTIQDDYKPIVLLFFVFMNDNTVFVPEQDFFPALSRIIPVMDINHYKRIQREDKR